MSKITWANLLHLYQPPNQNPALLKIIVKESYQSLLKILKNHPNLKFTVNFSGSLTELLSQNGAQNLIKGYKELALKNQIELTSTAKYHPILPLLPSNEIEHQIRINDKINKSLFGPAYEPQGFFCPEMAYSKKVGKIIKKLGFKWIILDEIAYNGKLNQVDFEKGYEIKDLGLKVIFRDRTISKSFVPESIYEKLKDKKDELIITATDAEMYGHHHKDHQNIFEKISKDKNLETIKISNLIKSYSEFEKISPKTCSWETAPSDLQKNMPFPLWDNPKNKVHQKIWQLANLAIKLNKQYNSENKNIWSRKHLDRGLASCTWWWASLKKPDVFSPLTWNPDEIENGIGELIRSIRSLKNISKKAKITAENIYLELIKIIWHKHWQFEK